MPLMPASEPIRGVLSPVVTPFDAQGAPSEARLIRLCRSMIASDIGLALFGTNSEANSLSVPEKLRLLDALVAQGLPPSRMMPGTGACALPDAIELTRHAVEHGCAGVLMLPPFFYKGVSDEGLYRSFATVIDRIADSRLRIYLYHIPAVSGVGLSHALIERLLTRYPTAIAGIKDSSGDWANTSAMIDRFAPSGFDVFAGNETFLLRTMQAGGAGCITATGNVNGRAIAHLARTWQQPDALLQQQRLDAVRAIFARFPIIAAMKAALAWQSGDEDWARVRPPLTALNATQRQELESALRLAEFSIEDAHALAWREDQPEKGVMYGN
jgi:4-hydroxy-tetrahydrodipicolinate synthase